MVFAAAPLGIDDEIASKAGTSELGGEAFTLFDGRPDLGFGCAALQESLLGCADEGERSFDVTRRVSSRRMTGKEASRFKDRALPFLDGCIRR